MASKVVSWLEPTSVWKVDRRQCSCSLCLGYPESVTPASSRTQPSHFPILYYQETESEYSLFTVVRPAEQIFLAVYLSLVGWPGRQWVQRVLVRAQNAGS